MLASGQDLGGLRLGRGQGTAGVREVFLDVLEVRAVEEVVLLEAAGLLDLHRVPVGPFQKSKADLEPGEHEVGGSRDGNGDEEEGEEAQGEACPYPEARPVKEGLPPALLAPPRCVAALGVVLHDVLSQGGSGYRGGLDRPWKPRAAAAFAMTSRSSCGLKGFAMKSKAPFAMASLATSTVAYPVIMTTFVFGCALHDALQYLDPVDVLHADVRHDDVELFLVEPFQGLPGRDEDLDVASHLGERRLEAFADYRLVVENKDLQTFHRPSLSHPACRKGAWRGCAAARARALKTLNMT